MKKLNLFLFYREKKKQLGALQRLGLVHVDMAREFDRPKHAKLVKLRERYLKIIAAMRKMPKPELDEHATFGFPRHLKALRTRLQYLEDRLELKERYESAVTELERDRKTMAPWGHFSLGQLDRLRGRGLRMRFMIGSAQVYDEFDFGDLHIELIRREGDRVYFLLLEYRVDTPAVLPFEEIVLPRRELPEIERELEILHANLEVDKLQLHEMSYGIPALEKEIRTLESALLFEEAKVTLEPHESGSIYSISGWFPARTEKEMRAHLEKRGVSYVMRDPDPGEKPPVLLKNRKPGGFFEPITRIFSLPDYFELDPTPFFAPFFALFFGLCLGDLGYGAIMMGLAGFAAWKLKPAFRPLAYLGLLLGVSTMVSGVLLNSFFGQALFNVPGEKGLLEKGGELAIFAAYSLRGRTQFPAMTLALLLGYIQLCLGIILQAVNAYRREGPMHVLQPLATLVMFWGGTIIAVHGDFLGLGFNAGFAVGPIPVGAMLSGIPATAGYVMLGLSLLIFFLFNNPGLKIFLRPLVGLWEFYQFLTGLLGDFLSYIRLFALGLASGLLGNAFNKIAFMILPRDAAGGIEYATPLIIVSILILVAGHSLNLALSALGAFVHPLRLTFVEFYKNLHFRGGGRLFRPFAIQK